MSLAFLTETTTTSLAVRAISLVTVGLQNPHVVEALHTATHSKTMKQMKETIIQRTKLIDET